MVSLRNVLLIAIFLCLCPLNAYGGCEMGDCENGQGVYLFPDGSKYSGQFRDTALHGTGTLIYKNGDKYAREIPGT